MKNLSIFLLLLITSIHVVLANEHPSFPLEKGEAYHRWKIRTRLNYYSLQHEKTRLLNNNSFSLIVKHDISPEFVLDYSIISWFTAQLGLQKSEHELYYENEIPLPIQLDNKSLIARKLDLLSLFTSLLITPEIIPTLKPYLGAGIAWLHFYQQTFSESYDLASADLSNQHYDKITNISIRPLIQLGLDWQITPKTAINIDLKKIFGQVHGEEDSPSTSFPDNKYRVMTNPTTIGIGFSYRLS